MLKWLARVLGIASFKFSPVVEDRDKKSKQGNRKLNDGFCFLTVQ